MARLLLAGSPVTSGSRAHAREESRPDDEALPLLSVPEVLRAIRRLEFDLERELRAASARAGQARPASPSEASRQSSPGTAAPSPPAEAVSSSVFALPAELLARGFEIFERAQGGVEIVAGSRKNGGPASKSPSQAGAGRVATAATGPEARQHGPGADARNNLSATMGGPEDGGPEESLGLDEPVRPEEIEILARESASPRLAASLAILAPGLGHLYAGQPAAAASVACLTVALFIGGSTLLHAGGAGLALGPFAPWSLATGGLVLLAAAVAALMASVRSAWNAAAAGSPFGRPRARSRPLLACLASALVPGWGQILNEQPRKGLAMLPAFPVGLAAAATAIPGGAGTRLAALRFPLLDPAVVSSAALALAGLAIIVWAVSIYDAALVGRQHRRSRLARPVAPSVD